MSNASLAAAAVFLAAFGCLGAAGCHGSDAKSPPGGCADEDDCKDMVERCEKSFDDDEKEERAQAAATCIAVGDSSLQRGDLSTAVRAFGKGCDRSDRRACDGLADTGAKLQATGAPANATAAFGLYHRACNGGSASGCYNLGFAYYQGIGVARSTQYAVFAFRKACEGGFHAGCTNVAVAYETGDGVAQDDAQAVAFFDKACAAGRQKACVSLGTHVEEGRGAAKDDFRAASLYDGACAANEDTGCKKLAALSSRNAAVGTYLEQQRRIAAERRAREAEQRSRDAEARARQAEADTAAARAREADDARQRQAEDAAQRARDEQARRALEDQASRTPPPVTPPPMGGGSSVRQQNLCYDFECNGQKTGKKCFSDKAAYCRSLCVETDCMSKIACSKECR